MPSRLHLPALRFAALGLFATSTLLASSLARAVGECPAFAVVDDAPELRFSEDLTITGDVLDLIDGRDSEVTGDVELREQDNVLVAQR